MKTKETSTYKTKGLEFYITNAFSKNHAIESFIHYRIGATENDIELFEGKIPDMANVMPAIEIKTRQQALAWWNNLSDISIQMPSKSHLCKKYHGDMRIHKSLTGREIEEIWRKEVGDLKLHKGEVVDESYPKEFQDAYLKPNQKQFKEFSKELFKSYIDKFSQENKARMLQILIDDLGVRELVDISVRSSEKV